MKHDISKTLAGVRRFGRRVPLFVIVLTALGIFAAGAVAKFHTLDTQSDLLVTKTGPDNATPGTNLTYNITVQNLGPDPAESAALNDSLPAGLTFVSLTSPAGWSCSTPPVGSGGQVQCTNASVAVGTVSFTLVVQLDSKVAPDTFITNIAVSSAANDFNEENDSSSATTLVKGASADVNINKTAPEAAPADSDVPYTITVKNVGPDDATNVVLNDPLPANMTFVSLTAQGGWSCTTPAVGSGGSVQCTKSSLTVAAGSQTFTLVAHIPPATVIGTEFSNTATVSSDADPTSENDLSTAGTTVRVSQTINFAPLPDKTFGDPDFTVSATASSGLPVSFDASGNCTVTVATVHLTAGGSCTITASQPGDSLTAAATNVPRTFNIAPADSSTTISSLVNPTNLNQTASFTATVTSSVGTPTGTVQFKDGGTNLGAPQSLDNSGVVTFTTSALIAGVHTVTADYLGNSSFLPSTATLSGGQQVGSIIKFSAANYNTTESSGSTQITVQRIGDLSAATTVDYATPDDSSAVTILPCSTPGGVAGPRCDFEAAVGRIGFAAGDGAPKTFTVLINQDNFVEGAETLSLTLSNPTGGAGFTTPGATSITATLTIADDLTEAATNPIDDTDNFVRQQYNDFLNREADASGLAFWKDNIDKCNDPNRRPAGLTQAQCIQAFRVDTSAAFFLSIEFQQAGYFVYRLNKVSFGDISPPTIPVPINFVDFVRDAAAVNRGVIVGQGSWQTQLDNNKTALTLEFVQRSTFLARYPGVTPAAVFVDTLNTNAGGVLTVNERSALITELSPNPGDPALRADVVRKITDNPILQQNEFNRAFVLMQYFGYLRRNPNAAPETGLNFGGYNFWLNKLNQFNGNFQGAEMVKAFVESAEYRQRFGP